MGGGIPPSPNCTSEGPLVSRHFLLEEDQVRRLLSMKLLYWERAVLSYVISTQTPRSLMSMLSGQALEAGFEAKATLATLTCFAKT